MRTLRNIFFAATTAVVCSCNLMDVDPVILQKDNLYQNDTDLRSGLAGVYGAINNEAFYGNYYSLMASNVDDLCYFNRTSSTNTLQMYRYDASTAEIDDIWTEIYKGVKNANAFLESMTVSELDNAPVYANEARFVRAYYHFILAQTFGNVPLRDKSVLSPYEVQKAATPQADVLKWVVEEMQATLPGLPEDTENAPSRVIRTTAKGILARVYLFMAGATVEGTDAEKKEYYRLAMTYAKEVIDSRKHRLNPDYSQVFKNMISDDYDTEYVESMWEADFLGDRSSADSWSNGRIGDLLGLQSSGASNFSTFNCNFAYGMYNGSLKLWDLYWVEDRTEDESKGETITDKRQQWNLPPYNYAGKTYSKDNPKASLPYDWPDPADENTAKRACQASIDKTPYSYGAFAGKEEGEGNTRLKATAAQSMRNAGKFRREAEYEGHKVAKNLYNSINFPILRYSDVLLMYAEAYNEYNGGPSQEVYDAVAEVRTRAGIKTKPYADYSTYEGFQTFVRNERGRELCFEALRKYDLIRWGIFVQEMNNYKYLAADPRMSKQESMSNHVASVGTNVQQKHTVLPIPSVELGVNELLKQHPLW